MNMTLIWLSCVMVAWTPAPNSPDGYHVEVAGHLVGDVVDSEYLLCLDTEYAPVRVRVQAFNEHGVGLWSDLSEEIMRVHDFDAAGNDGGGNDGIVGFADFGKFIQAFGYQHLPSGRVVAPVPP